MSQENKTCGNCDYFVNIKGFNGKCNLIKGCIGENVSAYNWCKDFKASTVSIEIKNAFEPIFMERGDVGEM